MCKIKIGDKYFKEGYNSHGKWSTLNEIRYIELIERSNPFPKNIPFPNNTPAIWVTLNPRDAARYALSADIWDTIDENTPIDPIILKDLTIIKFRSNDRIITNDGDGGYLLIRLKTSKCYFVRKTNYTDNYIKG